jgi:hypothetical protein
VALPLTELPSRTPIRQTHAETPLRAHTAPSDMVQVDPVLVAIVAVLLFIVLALFLLFRRTVKGFTDGLREGRRGR